MRSTLESSTAEDCSTPSDPVFGAPTMGRPECGGLFPQVVPERREALRVAEVGEHDLPEVAALAVGVAADDDAVVAELKPASRPEAKPFCDSC